MITGMLNKFTFLFKKIMIVNVLLAAIGILWFLVLTFTSLGQVIV